MATIDVYATGPALTFLPSERAERIVLKEPAWWSGYRIDFARDRAISGCGAVAVGAGFLLDFARQVASEKPVERWVRKEGAHAAQPRS